MDDYSEIDVGGFMSSRNSIGLGSLFCGYRFSLMNDRLFNYISYTGGDNRKLFYELNYMPNDNTLLDYIYKRKIDDELIPVLHDIGKEFAPGEPDTIKNKVNPNFVNFKHYFTIHKMLLSKANRVSFGIIRNNRTFFMNFSQKHSFLKNSIRTSLKFSYYSLKFRNKIKHKINESFICEVKIFLLTNKSVIQNISVKRETIHNDYIKK